MTGLTAEGIMSPEGTQTPAWVSSPGKRWAKARQNKGDRRALTDSFLQLCTLCTLWPDPPHSCSHSLQYDHSPLPKGSRPFHAWLFLSGAGDESTGCWLSLLFPSTLRFPPRPSLAVLPQFLGVKNLRHARKVGTLPLVVWGVGQESGDKPLGLSSLLCSLLITILINAR